MNETQKAPPLTVILTNYRRPHNITRIVENLRAQTLLPVIQLVDNAALPHPIASTIDRVALFPFGSGSYGRVLLSIFADTEWIALMADDVMPKDTDFLKDAYLIAKGRPDFITGCVGRGFSLKPPHYQGAAFGDVPIAAGHFIIFRKKILEKVRFYFEPIHEGREKWLRCDDLFLSLEIGRGKPVHWADKGLFDRMMSLPHGGAGLVKEEGHFRIREEMCAVFARTFGL